jgi:hypothetical protein
MVSKRIASLAGKNLSLKQIKEVRRYFEKQKNIPHYRSSDELLGMLDEHWDDQEAVLNCEICNKPGKISAVMYTTGAEFMESYPTVFEWTGSNGGVFSRNYRITLTEEGRKKIKRFGELDRSASNFDNFVQQYRIYCEQYVEKNAVVCNKCKNATLPTSIGQHITDLEQLGISLSEIIITTETGDKKILTKISDEKTKKETIILKPLLQK